MIIKATGEDFGRHWGFVNYKDRQVLDIGADFGSTAECFLLSGATKIFAVEGDEGSYKKLEEYVKNNPHIPIIPIYKWLKNKEDFIELFKINGLKRTDVIKIDCEGAEIHLHDVPEDILKSFKEYVIECHSHQLIQSISDKFKNMGFDIIDVIQISDGTDAIKVVWAINRN